MSWLEVDSLDLGASTAAMGDQIGKVLGGLVEAGQGAPAPGWTVVAVAGPGAGAFAADLVVGYALTRSPAPVTRLSGAVMPAFVGAGTLLVCIGAPGEEQATAAVARAGAAAGADVLAIGPVGSQLQQAADAAGWRYVAISYNSPAAGRVGAASSGVAGALVALDAAGLLPGAREELTAMLPQLVERGRELESGGGIAADIARRIGRTFPMMHAGSGELGAAVASRWKAQINENAKTPAFAVSEPVAASSEVCGYGQHGDITRQLFTLVNLHFGDAGFAARAADFAELTEEALAGVIDVTGSGPNLLAKALDLALIGDFVSLHMAAREGVDPGPVPAADEMRRRGALMVL